MKIFPYGFACASQRILLILYTSLYGAHCTLYQCHVQSSPWSQKLLVLIVSKSFLVAKLPRAPHTTMWVANTNPSVPQGKGNATSQKLIKTHHFLFLWNNQSVLVLQGAQLEYFGLIRRIYFLFIREDKSVKRLQLLYYKYLCRNQSLVVFFITGVC